MDRSGVEKWIEGYERAWRTPGTDALRELFSPAATYSPSPWARPLEGLADIARFWEAERTGPDEQFTMTHEVVAVEGATAVVRVSVDYATESPWRDLWVVGFDGAGRCSAFEEWPFAPRQPDGH
ncbi:MAG: nuclear transport factor 2 family protein [Acidimicrobiales bacterium]